jgi:hypothetical protein
MLKRHLITTGAVAIALAASGCGGGGQKADPEAQAYTQAYKAVSGLSCALALSDLAHAELLYVNGKGTRAQVKHPVDFIQQEAGDADCTAKQRAKLKAGAFTLRYYLRHW